MERVVCPNRGKAHQKERRLARPIREKAQEGERRLRRVKEEEAAHMAKPREAQQGWWGSFVEELRKKGEKHCRKGVLKEMGLLELGWMTGEIVVSYLTYKCRKERSYVEDN